MGRVLTAAAPRPVSTAPASFGLRMRSATTRPWSTATLLPQSSTPPAPPTEKASDAAMRPVGKGLVEVMAELQSAVGDSKLIVA